MGKTKGGEKSCSALKYLNNPISCFSKGEKGQVETPHLTGEWLENMQRERKSNVQEGRTVLLRKKLSSSYVVFLKRILFEL